MDTKYDHPDHAPMVHVPDMESMAVNPMPKVGYRELRLMRYVGTDLYQWYGIKTGAIFEDPCDAPFQMKLRDYSEYGRAINRLTQDAVRGGYSRSFADHQVDLNTILSTSKPSTALIELIDQAVVSEIGDQVSDCIDGHDWTWDAGEFARLRADFTTVVSGLLAMRINVPDAMTANLAEALKWLDHGLRDEWTPDAHHLASVALDNAVRSVELIKAAAQSAPVVEDDNETLTDVVVAVAGILLQTGERSMDRNQISQYATEALGLLKALRPQLIVNQPGEAA
ncbi:hypothetical protein GURKE_00410 [Brevundimonas phage vB_BpoS-Gurke]|uniref:Uncharacterized protein n=1 Tax=Brevundimonas phage vB_BpoS-Gurke TaxID=2948599 RepID=A0A9E7N1M1_9CAUD|nr:hypothetical protein GURKE_00410 [Brevundimonas phage vB_BpoS-Gurke]